MGKEITPRVAIDTNVLISCLLFGGQLSWLRSLWLEKRIIPLLSRETFDEFRRVLAYPKFSLSLSEIRAIINDEILPYFEVIEVEQITTSICRDPHDEKILAVADAGKASYIITGDMDLLVLQTFGNIKIITPKDFQTFVACPPAAPTQP